VNFTDFLIIVVAGFFFYKILSKKIVSLKKEVDSLKKELNSSANGTDSKSGTLCHEMSHFNSVGATKDHVYGTSNSNALAKADPDKALTNADNFEYYCEGACGK